MDQPYTQNLAASGGTGGPYSWILSAGRLPEGLSLDAKGAITGTPAKAGSFALTLQVNDAAGAKPRSQEFTIDVTGQRDQDVPLSIMPLDTDMSRRLPTRYPDDSWIMWAGRRSRQPETATPNTTHQLRVEHVRALETA